jgi:hypothetical protein
VEFCFDSSLFSRIEMEAFGTDDSEQDYAFELLYDSDSDVLLDATTDVADITDFTAGHSSNFEDDFNGFINRIAEMLDETSMVSGVDTS